MLNKTRSALCSLSFIILATHSFSADNLEQNTASGSVTVQNVAIQGGNTFPDDSYLFQRYNNVINSLKKPVVGPVNRGTTLGAALIAASGLLDRLIYAFNESAYYAFDDPQNWCERNIEEKQQYPLVVAGTTPCIPRTERVICHKFEYNGNPGLGLPPCNDPSAFVLKHNVFPMKISDSSVFLKTIYDIERKNDILTQILVESNLLDFPNNILYMLSEHRSIISCGLFYSGVALMILSPSANIYTRLLLMPQIGNLWLYIVSDKDSRYKYSRYTVDEDIISFATIGIYCIGGAYFAMNIVPSLFRSLCSK